LREEHPEYPIAEVTVRQYVRKRKQERGGRVVFVPQSYEWGREAQVDWFDAVVKLEGEPCKLQFFAMRSMASGDSYPAGPAPGGTLYVPRAVESLRRNGQFLRRPERFTRVCIAAAALGAYRAS
jgi:hypothetical protein